jgi:hypothetical protein
MKKLLAAITAVAISASSTSAAVMWTFEETGGDVVGTLSGTLDISGFSGFGGGTWSNSFVRPSDGLISSRTASSSTRYALTTADGAFGTSGRTNATSFTGDFLAVSGSAFASNPNSVWVPQGYSGGSLSGTQTYFGQTFASLGITVGTYRFALGTDTITLAFEPIAAVPLPSGIALMLGALGSFAFWRRRRMAV